MGNQHEANFEIAVGYSTVSKFIDAVRTAADSHRNELGFFPKTVFEDYARRDELFVLFEKSSSGDKYVGHLMFDCRFPRAHVLQMFVSSEYRGRGLAGKLIGHLRRMLTRQGFISIYARVAEDLKEANSFWNRQGFYVQRVAPGGATRKRIILIRCHELSSPQLFPPSGINAQNPLGLITSPSSEAPLFLLDMNVLFDINPRRLRHDLAASLFHAERMNFCRLAISSEIRQELLRTATVGRTDPMEAYISIYPTFPFLEGESSNLLLDELASLVFPLKRKAGSLSANDYSDLKHVATAIQHNLAGLITNDESIVLASAQIEKKYRVKVISPTSFLLPDAVSFENDSFETPKSSTLSLQPINKEQELVVHELLSKVGLTGSTIASGWMPSEEKGRIAARYGVWNGELLIGYLTWPAWASTGTVAARIAIDETDSEAIIASRILLMYLLDRVALSGPQQINLEFPAHQSHVRELAAGLGFQGTPKQNSLSKLAVGSVLTSRTWGKVREELVQKGGLKLPVDMPVFRSADQQIQILAPNGNQVHLALDFLETLLSPTLFCLPGRQAVITPVQRSFAEPLLGHSKQASLLPQGTASLFQERLYVSNFRTLRKLKKGTLILFYESTKQGGRGEVVAIARVRHSYLKPSHTFGDSDFDQSVLDFNSLTAIGKSLMKTVTFFDNIFPLPRSVPLSTLKALGCGKPNDLITTHEISDVQLQAILNEAFNV